MSQCRCNRRRRKQAAQGFNHIHRAKRPHYSKSASTGSTRLGGPK